MRLSDESARRVSWRVSGMTGASSWTSSPASSVRGSIGSARNVSCQAQHTCLWALTLCIAYTSHFRSARSVCTSSLYNAAACFHSSLKLVSLSFQAEHVCQVETWSSANVRKRRFAAGSASPPCRCWPSCCPCARMRATRKALRNLGCIQAE